jgi:prophage maintenance system killer protein
MGSQRTIPSAMATSVTAFVCAAVFLGLNGVKLTLSEPRAIEMMLALAAGKMSQEDVANLIREPGFPRLA